MPTPEARLPPAVPYVVGGGMVLYGNALVLAVEDCDHREVLTLGAQAALGTAAVVGCRLAGLRWVDLGLCRPNLADRRAGLLLGGAGSLVAGAVLVAWARRAACSTDTPVPMVLARMLAGTAFGEELLFRGVLLALLLGARQDVHRVVTCQVACFTAWHVAGAGSLLGLLGPAAGAVLFLWARAHYESLVVPALLHATTNVPTWVLSHCAR
jgi:membrane protease YdiL (CAAX protease family)